MVELLKTTKTGRLCPKMTTITLSSAWTRPGRRHGWQRGGRMAPLQWRTRDPLGAASGEDGRRHSFRVRSGIRIERRSLS